MFVEQERKKKVGATEGWKWKEECCMLTQGLEDRADVGGDGLGAEHAIGRAAGGGGGGGETAEASLAGGGREPRSAHGGVAAQRSEVHTHHLHLQGKGWDGGRRRGWVDGEGLEGREIFLGTHARCFSYLVLHLHCSQGRPDSRIIVHLKYTVCVMSVRHVPTPPPFSSFLPPALLPSLLTPVGSRFSLSVPLNRKGFWGMTESRRRKSCRPRVEVLMPSMVIDPPLGSIRRKRA